MAHLGWRSRGYLPHCDSPGTIQHIVFNLKDALPPVTQMTFEDVQLLLDHGAGECLLARRACAELVQNCLRHYDGVQYRLIAWCVMPNHVHVLAEQLPGHALHTIVHGWKSVSAHRINKALGRTGALWQREYFDRFMRDDSQLAATVAYIESNPVAAQFVETPGEWAWSSAAHR
ncbi:MAG: transposase [Alphaproteobacteria bacterium]|nr:transposase [Alphaproteobacteria bacterium]